jgi:hypothetical protein
MCQQHLPKKILTAFCHSPRHSSGHQRTHRDHFSDAVQIIIPELTKDAHLKAWGGKTMHHVTYILNMTHVHHLLIGFMIVLLRESLFMNQKWAQAVDMNQGLNLGSI